MISLLATAQDAAVESDLRSDLTAHGYEMQQATTAADDIVIVVLSRAALQDTSLQSTLAAALDRGQHIIPTLAEPVRLPKLIDHLTPVDLSAQDATEQLYAQIEAANSPDARLSLRVRTPSVQRSNRRSGLIVGILALAMFIIGVYAVAVLNIEAPVEEYNQINTEAAATRDIIIGPTLENYLQFLPGSLEEAEQYPATLQAVPTRLRPFVQLTATAVAVDQQAGE
ncbi:MAG: toll/interleukin-1 receptor domain-containing protein [Anaerolineae bacterium]|nr:toll/interleukin-1 receptor domain-containing protein [Anaerolineae bacterium]